MVDLLGSCVLCLGCFKDGNAMLECWGEAGVKDKKIQTFTAKEIPKLLLNDCSKWRKEEFYLFFSAYKTKGKCDLPDYIQYVNNCYQVNTKKSYILLSRLSVSPTNLII